MRKISFICCYTKFELVEQLKNSVKDFIAYDIEWILIDNSHNSFKSAASALNVGANRSTADVFVFIHQDIEFDSESTLNMLYEQAISGKIVGVAGRKENGGPLVTTITDGKNQERCHHYLFKTKYENVLSCDECVIAMSKATYLKVDGFDEVNFDGWHFYGVDLCLRAKEKGIQTIVVPSHLWHKSTGNHDKNWKSYEKKLRQIYRDKYKVIFYPCGRCYTNIFLFYFVRISRFVKKLIK